jgi:hypothetical protein
MSQDELELKVDEEPGNRAAEKSSEEGLSQTNPNIQKSPTKEKWPWNYVVIIIMLNCLIFGLILLYIFTI